MVLTLSLVELLCDELIRLTEGVEVISVFVIKNNKIF
jgi:hypothetical protein